MFIFKSRKVKISVFTSSSLYQARLSAVRTNQNSLDPPFMKLMLWSVSQPFRITWGNKMHLWNEVIWGHRVKVPRWKTMMSSQSVKTAFVPGLSFNTFTVTRFYYSIYCHYQGLFYFQNVLKFNVCFIVRLPNSKNTNLISNFSFCCIIWFLLCTEKKKVDKI